MPDFHLRQVGEIIESKYIDLHAHTTCSDGRLTPEALADLAIKSGLSALAITDHDAVAGIEAAKNHTENIEIISGVELSASDGPTDIHILGYFIDPTHAGLIDHLEKFRSSRYDRARSIVEKLNELGAPISFESILVQVDDQTASIGRPHIARALVEAGHVKSLKGAFKEFLGNRAPAYVPKSKISVEEAIQIILEAGGLAVMAHPGSTRRDELIPQFARSGLSGIEVFHPDHSVTERKYYFRIAERNRLAVTGGSDFHGSRPDRPVLGSLNIEYKYLDVLRSRWVEIHN